ncbi:MAG: head GIN domain-containing protein [Deltaproteobacteria bacterium]
MKLSHLLLLSIVIILISYLGSLLFKSDVKINNKKIVTESFTGVKNKIGADVYVKMGDKHDIVVKTTGDVMKNLSIRVKDGVLIIDSISRKLRYDSIRIEITMVKMNFLSIEGSGTISMTGTFNASDDVELGIAGSGTINADFTTSGKLKAGIAGSGDMELKGKSSEMELGINGSGGVKGFNFNTTSATINIAGSGDCEISVVKELNANINGSGNVYYKGSPIVNANINGSGEVQNAK